MEFNTPHDDDEFDEYTLDERLFGLSLQAREQGADDETLAALAAKHDAIVAAHNAAVSGSN